MLFQKTHIRNLIYFLVIFQFIGCQTSWRFFIEVGENIILNIM